MFVYLHTHIYTHLEFLVSFLPAWRILEEEEGVQGVPGSRESQILTLFLVGDLEFSGNLPIGSQWKRQRAGVLLGSQTWEGGSGALAQNPHPL